MLKDTTDSGGVFSIKGEVSVKFIHNTPLNAVNIFSALPYRCLVAIYNLRGQMVARCSVQKNEYLMPSLRKEMENKSITPNGVYIINITHKLDNVVIKMLGSQIKRSMVSGRNLNAPSSQSKTRQQAIDTLIISYDTFPQTKIPLTAYILNLDTISFTRSVDENGNPISCAEQRIQAKALAQNAVDAVKDSIIANPLGQKIWQSSGTEIPLGTNKKIVLKNKRHGGYAFIEGTGYYYEVACLITCIAVRKRPAILEPILTLTGSIGGLIVTDSSELDLNGKVVLHHGEIKDKNYNVIPKYEDMVETKISPALPVDSSHIASILSGLNRRYNTLLVDTTALVIDSTYHINSVSDLAGLDPFIVLNNCIIRGTSLKNRTIVCNKDMIVDSASELKNCTVLSDNLELHAKTTQNCVFGTYRRISISSGVHNSQFFAYDSIFVGKNVTTDPLAFFVCQATNKGMVTITGHILFSSGSNLKGTAIICRDSSAVELENCKRIILDTLSAFTGICISEKDLTISGQGAQLRTRRELPIKTGSSGRI